MRINIDWMAPWVHGRPLKRWVWHWWYVGNGMISGGANMGIRLLGLSVQISTDALLSGITVSLHLWEKKRQ